MTLLTAPQAERRYTAGGEGRPVNHNGRGGQVPFESGAQTRPSLPRPNFVDRPSDSNLTVGQERITRGFLPPCFGAGPPAPDRVEILPP